MHSNMPYFIYILQSERDGSYYVGHTSNLDKRLKRHNEGRSTYTRTRIPWRVIYQEALPSRKAAMKREKKIKSMKSRGSILELVRASR